MQMTCPDEEKLVDYFERRLPEKNRKEIQKHIADCDLCLTQLAIMRGLAKNPDRFELEPVPDRVTESVVERVAQLSVASHSPFMIRLKRAAKHLGERVSEFLGITPWAGWGFASVRGTKIAVSDELVSLKVSFGKINTSIEIEKMKDSMAHIRMRLLNSPDSLKPVRITLKKGNREVASYLLEAYALFERVPFDHYNISMFIEGKHMGTYFFEIKENGYDGKKQ
ncbi:MAG: hypothetical protein GY699_01500 [Desulfobacteraceae bacterium]|nr:hypothetical protein [Desulfobacteraceae bacterium]